VLRAVASTATEIASMAYDSPLDVRDFVAEAEARLWNIARQPIGESADIWGRRPAVPNERERECIADAACRLGAMSIEVLHRRGLRPADVRREARLVLPKFDGKLDLSQLNRESVKTPSGEPELWHLRESGAIEQDADTVIFLWDAPAKSRFDPDAKSQLEIGQATQRTKDAVVRHHLRARVHKVSRGHD
jgi:hypothetical protein